MRDTRPGFGRFRTNAMVVAIFFLGPVVAWGQMFPSEPANQQAKQGTQLGRMFQCGQSTPANQSNPPSLLTPLKQQTEKAAYIPISSRQRLRWFLTNTLGPHHLARGMITSAFGTAVDRPKEYGPHWDGFADRYGMRLTGIVTGNAMEASAGALWGEDPRYFRVPGEPFKVRVQHVIRLTFVARRRDGRYAPAYARFIAISGNNFLANSWRPDSEANNHDAILRTLEGFAGRMASNAFDEFWPDAKSHLFHRDH
ncbi:MAG TPA: hypothetical protein VNE63_14805 [Candidatus Acidoferrales bacterium]|nr:hypothetical protein [Candidatus Acidoferrales bacterium]